MKMTNEYGAKMRQIAKNVNKNAKIGPKNGQ